MSCKVIHCTQVYPSGYIPFTGCVPRYTPQGIYPLQDVYPGIPLRVCPTYAGIYALQDVYPAQHRTYTCHRVLVTVKFVSRAWSPGKNIIVVLEVKYTSASCTHSESVAQWILWGQDEHEVGVTQYPLSAEQQEKVLVKSVATRTIMMCTSCVVTTAEEQS